MADRKEETTANAEKKEGKPKAVDLQSWINEKLKVMNSKDGELFIRNAARITQNNR